MATITVPGLVWRDGRPRWVPSPRLRKLGKKGINLKRASGEWMTEAEAIETARRINAGVEPSHALSGPSLPVPVAPRALAVRHVPASAMTVLPPATESPRALPRTLHMLMHQYRKTTRFRDENTEATRRAYEYHYRLFDDWAGDCLVANIDRTAIQTYFHEISAAKGKPTGNQALAAIKRLMTYAHLEVNWIPFNPTALLKGWKLDGRIVVWEREELAAFAEVAVARGFLSMADAVYIGAYSAQRLIDIRALPLKAYDGTRLMVVQIKTGATVLIPLVTGKGEPTHLKRRIDAILARRPAVYFDTMLICESTGKAWSDSYFRQIFNEVRDEAAKRIPALAGKRFQDLRDTAVTWLVLADCTYPQVSRITGHSEKTVARICKKHYLGKADEIASAAMDKLDSYIGNQEQSAADNENESAKRRASHGPSHGNRLT